MASLLQVLPSVMVVRLWAQKCASPYRTIVAWHPYCTSTTGHKMHPPLPHSNGVASLLQGFTISHGRYVLGTKRHLPLPHYNGMASLLQIYDWAQNDPPLQHCNGMASLLQTYHEKPRVQATLTGDGQTGFYILPRP